MTPPAAPRIYVLAGVNGAGKSSIGGAALRHFGGDYFNPDEAARALLASNPGLGQADANAMAWQLGRTLLERAISQRLDFAIETTLGANTMPRLLREAAAQGIEIRVWYVGLCGLELHIERVRARVLRGGHAIAEADIRRRYVHSRLNLIHLLPHLFALRIYDNSANADPAQGLVPAPRLILSMAQGKILGTTRVALVPEWARPIVAAAIKLNLA